MKREMISYLTVGNTGVIVTPVVVDRTLLRRTVLLVLSSGTVGDLVTSPVAGDTEDIGAPVCRTLELVGETLVVLAVVFVTGVLALDPPVADLSGVETLGLALELSRSADEAGTVLRLVLAVPTVVLAVTPPPERDTLEGVGAEELAPAAVRLAGDPVLGQEEVLRTAAHGAQSPIIVPE